MNRLMMIGSVVLTGLSGLGCVGLVLATAFDFAWATLVCAVLLALSTCAFGTASSYYGGLVVRQGHGVFTNEAEKEVLNRKQRQELRRARGELVMERALIEVEHERDNIVHRQIAAANDPNKPPHQTRWTSEPTHRELNEGDYR